MFSLVEKVSVEQLLMIIQEALQKEIYRSREKLKLTVKILIAYPFLFSHTLIQKKQIEMSLHEFQLIKQIWHFYFPAISIPEEVKWWNSTLNEHTSQCADNWIQSMIKNILESYFRVWLHFLNSHIESRLLLLNLSFEFITLWMKYIISEN